MSYLFAIALRLPNRLNNLMYNLQQWKERTKLRHKLSAAKKKLREMGQQHVLEGFSSGDKTQKTLLANQIVGIDFKLLQRALQCLNLTTNRFSIMASLQFGFKFEQHLDMHTPFA